MAYKTIKAAQKAIMFASLGGSGRLSEATMHVRKEVLALHALGFGVIVLPTSKVLFIEGSGFRVWGLRF